MIVFLDTNALGGVANPVAKSQNVQDLKRWAKDMTDAGHQLIVPAITDYEIRREHCRRQAVRSITALDQFISEA